MLDLFSDKPEKIHFFTFFNKFTTFIVEPRQIVNENMWQKIQLARAKDISISFTLIAFIILSVVSLGDCLYEDQVGKFDW